MDYTLAGLRTLCAVADRGSLTAAAAALGYTQSAVSRQIAGLERAAGSALIERRPRGVALTAAGALLRRRAIAALAELAEADAELATGGRGRVVLGCYPSAGAALLPAVLPRLAAECPDLDVVVRSGSTPALVRGLRAGTLDAAVLSSRPPYRSPDDLLPRLRIQVLATVTLALAVPTGAFPGRDRVHADELTGTRWIAGFAAAGEPALGVWPGLPGHPASALEAHEAGDWLTKLALVAAGCGVTTVVPGVPLPAGVRTVTLDGVPAEHRRVLAAAPPGPPPSAGVEAVLAALATEATRLSPTVPGSG